MDIGVGVDMCGVVVKKFTFAISSPDEFLLLGEEAVASPSIGNTLWRVPTTFTRSAITPPEVNGFG